MISFEFKFLDLLFDRIGFINVSKESETKFLHCSDHK